MSLKLLIKYPTRSRPEQFLKVLQAMVSTAKHPELLTFLVSFDVDDESMNGAILQRASQIHNGITFVAGTSRNKVHAINRDMEMAGEWDIVMVASDDMIPQVEGWDEIIREGFNEDVQLMNTLTMTIQPEVFKMPNLDKSLWFFDGHQHRICTLVVMGKDRYNKFNYIYHPDYISLWCDNEWTEVNAPVKNETILFKHEHPAWGGGLEMDALYQRNEGYFTVDEATYMRRKSLNFPI